VSADRAMHLDRIDAAFVDWWNTARESFPHDHAGSAAVAEPPPQRASPRPASEQDADEPAAIRAMPPDITSQPQQKPEDALRDRLLAAAPDEWDAVAARVEDARLRGRRVIAIAGSQRGEGRSTLVECVATTLRRRGAEVICVDSRASGGVGPDRSADVYAHSTHDRRILLVDAGIWFPPGPIRRQRLLAASLGCDAAILVRRTGSPSGDARRAALEAIGIEVLGEVLTFASLPSPSGDGPTEQGS
jgi:hypothetical protein